MFKVYFDGACEPNPGGIIGYGAVIYRHDEKIYEIAKTPNLKILQTTNNIAEYIGLIAALKYLLSQKWEEEEIYFFGDSRLVINQMAGIWDINDGKYLPFAKQAKKLLANFHNVNFEWIPKERNTEADSLSRRVYRGFR